MSECTDQLCSNEAKYALWMGDGFSRVRSPSEASDLEDGDLSPYVCEDCLDRYERRHGHKGEFIPPEEKLVTDGGVIIGEWPTADEHAVVSDPITPIEDERGEEEGNARTRKSGARAKAPSHHPQGGGTHIANRRVVASLCGDSSCVPLSDDVYHSREVTERE